MSKSYTSRPLIEGLYFPEGLRWFAGRLIVGDIWTGLVGEIRSDGKIEPLAMVNGPSSGIGFLGDGSVIASLMKDRKLVKITGQGKLTDHADLSGLGMDHINDIVTDAAGRTYVDSLHYHMHWLDPVKASDGTLLHKFRNDASKAPAGTTDDILLVQADGKSAHVVAQGLMGPNGLALSGDGKTLVVAEWRANRLTQFDVAQDGSLSNRQLFAETPGVPDGICMDAEGAVWVASPSTGDCIRVTKGGKILARVKVAGKRATSCVLGGVDRRTLYISTDEMPEPGTGRIEIVDEPMPAAGAGYP